MKTWYLLLLCSSSLVHGEQIIFSSDNYMGTGDNLSSLYNAYVYAKKYNLKLEYGPFACSEQFECSNILKPLNSDVTGNLVVVRTEQDIVNSLGNPNAKFCVNVMSDRLVPDSVTAAEAKQLLMPNRNLSFDHLKSSHDGITIVVHVRKGNNPENYHGEQSAPQIYDFDRSIVQYRYIINDNPFVYYRTIQLKNRDILDNYWPLKYPPEQFYIDQVNMVIRSKSTHAITVKIITDDRDSVGLMHRFKQQINYPNVKIERYDNAHKEFKTRLIEDLYLMSQADVFIHAKSSFAFVAEVMGNHKTVIFPEKSQWINNKLIMSEVIIRVVTPW